VASEDRGPGEYNELDFALVACNSIALESSSNSVNVCGRSSRTRLHVFSNLRWIAPIFAFALYVAPSAFSASLIETS
jgi:hypothetical protein